MRGPRQRPGVESQDRAQLQPFGLLKRLGQRIGRFLLGDQKSLPNGTEKVTVGSEDLSYDLTLSSEDAQNGTWVTISIDRGQGHERLKVRIPPGTRSGTRLRLKGKGKRQDGTSGDLYLTVNLD